MKNDVEKIVVDEDGNVIESETIEKVKPVLKYLKMKRVLMTRT
jgi:DNA gyrase subunit A